MSGSTAGARHLAESSIWLAYYQENRIDLHPQEWTLAERIVWPESRWLSFLVFAASLPIQEVLQ